MDFAELGTLIGSYGFPIVMCIVMAWYVKTQTESNNARIDKLNQEHKEEVAKMTEALNNNTIALQRLIDKMGED